MEEISKYMVKSLGVKALLITLVVSHAFAGVRNKQVWDHHETLDRKGRYQLYWSADKNIVTFQVEVDTQGWVGFGLSPDGEFEGSDIVIGGVNKDKKYFTGYHVDKHGKLQLDTQKWTMISVAEEKGRVILIFRTKLESCNPETLMIPGETNSLLYAYSDEDFPSPDKIRLKKEMWTVTKLKLLQPRINEIEMPKEVKYFDIRMPNFTLPGNMDTVHACAVFKGPQLREKHHIIKISPIVRPRNEEYTHHLFLSKCGVSSTVGEAMVSRGVGECMVDTIALSLSENCSELTAGWGRGGGSFIYPTKAGLPIGEEFNEYYNLQVHYDNPTFLNDIVDDSGVRIYYTPILRKHDASQMGIGFRTMSSFVIPPGQREFVLAGHGHPRCFSESTGEAIRVFAVFLHAHLIATKIKVRHFRNRKELPPLAIDNHFDHHFQNYVFLEKDVLILPEDHLTVECTYDSTSRDVTTFARGETSDEMCVFGIFYYPRISLNGARIDINPALLAGLTGLDLSDMSNSTSGTMDHFPLYERHLLHYDWTKEQTCTVQNAQRFSPQFAICQMNDSRLIFPPPIAYPENVKVYRIPSVCPESSIKGGKSETASRNECNRDI